MFLLLVYVLADEENWQKDSRNADLPILLQTSSMTYITEKFASSLKSV